MSAYYEGIEAVSEGLELEEIKAFLKHALPIKDRLKGLKEVD